MLASFVVIKRRPLDICLCSTRQKVIETRKEGMFSIEDMIKDPDLTCTFSQNGDFDKRQLLTEARYFHVSRTKCIFFILDHLHFALTSI